MNPDFLSGKGGGGGSGKTRTPVEDPNTLQSRAVARIVGLVSEGEIEGLVNGENSILFDNIPIRNTTGEYNFNGVSSEFKPGAPDGIELKEYPTSESEVDVSTAIIKDNGPITKNINDSNIDAVKLTFSIDRLVETNSTNGDQKETELSWKIEIKQSSSSVWTDVVTITKKGKCTSPYPCDYRIDELSRKYGNGPWDIRVTRITDDSDSSYLSNGLYWASYTQIINRPLIYPNSAVIGITLDSSQFGSRLPNISLDIYGERVKIPSNYNPITREYNGLWDGTFKISYTNNPAWIYYDMATNTRYGCKIKEEYIDVASLYLAAQYNDQLVDDGEGGTEPRFTFNSGFLKSMNEGHMLNLIASSFRAMPYWAGNKLYIYQDRPGTPSKLITAANVVNGIFNRSYQKDDYMYSVVSAMYNNPDNQYILEPETAQDDDAITQSNIGYKENTIVAVGCTSRGQAYRQARWTLYTNLYQTETITFRADLFNADVVPGDIITVMDNHEANVRYGGRVSSITTDTITLDGEVELVVGETYSITCVGLDGTLLTRDITTVPDGLNHTTLEVSDDWPIGNEPQVDSVWIIESNTLSAANYRVVSNEEIEPHIYEITALIYDENKYSYVEDGIKLQPPPLTKVPDANTQLEPPTNINVEIYTYDDNDGNSSLADRKTGALLSWTHTRDVRFQAYEVQWKLSTGSYNLTDYKNTTSNSVDIKPITSGLYSFRVRALGLTRESTWLELTEYEVNSIPDAPPDITNLKVLNGIDDTTFNGKDCEIGWDALELIISDSTSYQLTKIKDYQIEILTIGDVHLRYEFTTDNSFKYYFGMNQLDNGTPLRTFKFKIWGRDIFGQLSNNPAILVVENPIPTMSGLTPTVTPIFSGLKVDWSAITPTDNDMSKFKVYIEDVNPPTIEVAEVGVNTNYWIEGTLTPNINQYVQIEPYDEFGAGVKSDVVTSIPLKITIDDLEAELLGRLTITDSLDSTSLVHLYDKVTDEGSGILYDSTSWIKYTFPIENIIDRVVVYADKTFNCYVSLSSDGSTWTYYKGEGDHTLTSENRLVEATDESDAITNYWTADSGDGNINLALFPNGVTMKYARIHILTDDTEIYELIFVDQVIVEQVLARNVTADNGVFNIIGAGLIQSLGYTTDAGILIDLENDTINMGGSDGACISYDGNQTLSLKGNLDVEEGGVLTVGNDNIIIDSDVNSIIVAPDGGPTGNNYAELQNGNIYFKVYDSITATHYTYNSLKRMESGVATANGSTPIYIPGYWKGVPTVNAFPLITRTYDPAYSAQAQELYCNTGTVSLQAGQTNKYQFTPTMQLRLQSATSTVGVGSSYGPIYHVGSGPWVYITPGSTDVIVTSPTIGLRQISVDISADAYCTEGFPVQQKEVNIVPTLWVYYSGAWYYVANGISQTSFKNTVNWTVTSPVVSGDILKWNIWWTLDNPLYTEITFTMNYSFNSYTKYFASSIVYNSGMISWIASE